MGPGPVGEGEGVVSTVIEADAVGRLTALGIGAGVGVVVVHADAASSPVNP